MRLQKRYPIRKYQLLPSKVLTIAISMAAGYSFTFFHVDGDEVRLIDRQSGSGAMSKLSEVF